MGGLRRAGGCQHVLDLLKVMPTKGVTPNNYTYRAALLACAQVKVGSVSLDLNTVWNTLHTLLVYSVLRYICRTLVLTFRVLKGSPRLHPGTYIGLLSCVGFGTTTAHQGSSGFQTHALSLSAELWGQENCHVPLSHQQLSKVVHIQLGKCVLSAPSRYQRTVLRVVCYSQA